MHKVTTNLSRIYAFIAVGNVNAKQLAQGRMAKSLNSKDNYRASRLTAIWMQANVTKAARVPARFS